MLVVDYNVNIRCPEAGLGREILGKSRGTYSDRARRRGFEQQLDTLQRVLITGGDSRLDCFILLDGRELSQPFQFRYLLIPQTHACVWAAAQAPKGPSIFDWDVREITHSLTRVAWSSSHLL